jgi:integrase
MARRQRKSMIELPVYVRVKSAKGRTYFYLERPGFDRVRLPGRPGTPDFEKAYAESMTAQRPLPGQSGIIRGSFADLCARYLRSPSFTGLADATRQVYRRIIDQMRERHGGKPVALLDARAIKTLIAEVEAPTAKRRRLSVLRILCDHAVETDMLTANPCRDIKPARHKARGFHSWTEAEIEQFEAKHPSGSRARLALALLLYTGQRRGDVTRIQWAHIAGSALRIVQQKTGAELELPVLPPLAAELGLAPRRGLFVLTTEAGHPFTPAGFGNWFRDICNAAGLPHCSAHGLRKAAARRLAEAGCTPHQIAAWTGHESLREVERYTRAASQRSLAAQAAAVLPFARANQT